MLVYTALKIWICIRGRRATFRPNPKQLTRWWSELNQTKATTNVNSVWDQKQCFFCFLEPRSHGRTNFIQRDERSLKMQEHLKKRLKDRQASSHTNNKLNSPPSSPHKVNNSSSAAVQNGNGKGQQGTGGPLKQKQIGKTKGSPDAEMGGRLHQKG